MLTMENVMQILQWGPLIAKRCPQTKRVVTLDTVPHPTTGKPMHRVAEPGERVPVQRQYLIPDPKRKGRTGALPSPAPRHGLPVPLRQARCRGLRRRHHQGTPVLHRAPRWHPIELARANPRQDPRP
ncbi:hypothetical protein P4234_24360 [Pseudomonas aeruginosa]|nr:hypothetical protein [Pseudomonas aeruginosa]